MRQKASKTQFKLRQSTHTVLKSPEECRVGDYIYIKKKRQSGKAAKTQLTEFILCPVGLQITSQEISFFLSQAHRCMCPRQTQDFSMTKGKVVLCDCRKSPC